MGRSILLDKDNNIVGGNGVTEKAVPPSRRIKAIEKLWAEGFDVQLRLSPFIPEFVKTGVLDLDIINAVKCDKILIEFLRVNAWVKIDRNMFKEKKLIDAN